MGRYADGGREETDGAPSAAVRAGGGDALSAPRSYRSLLTGAIDYAGLFPPASLGIVEAVADYHKHRQAPDQWALGRFVVPLARWNELESAVREVAVPGDVWPVSLLAGPADVERIRAIMSTSDEHLRVEAVECKAESVNDVAKAAELVRMGIEVFVELSLSAGLDALAAEIKRAGAAAKIRTGGTSAEAFPTSSEVLSFLRACRKARIRFKATAGLHHAVRGDYRLTYEPSPPTGVMFGFLNIAMAAALTWFDRNEDAVLAVLEERSADAFEFTDDGASWRHERFSQSELDEVRRAFFVGFGSCSFSEPMAEIGLEALPRA